MEKQLPKNWTNTELSNLISHVIGGDWGKEIDFTDEDYVEALCIRGSEIKNWTRDKGSSASLRKIKKSSLESRKLDLGDILLEISGGGPEQPVGRTVIIDYEALAFEPTIPKVCTNFLRLLRLDNKVNSTFINHYLQFFYNSGEITKYQGGSNNLRNLKFKEYETIKIPLPPLPEQNRIVTKLDALFTQLETIKSNLANVPLLLKDFRQQVLTQAVTGKLTEEWRKGKKLEDSDRLFDKIYLYKKKWAETECLKGNSEAKRLLSKIKIKKSIKSHDIPNIWGYFSLLDINHLVVDCHNKTAPYEDKGIYLIRTTNIKKGRIVLNDMRYVSEDTYQFWSKRCFPYSGDILFTREAPMGEAAIIPKNMKICLGQRTMLIRTVPDLLENKYVLYCLLSNKMTTQINEKAIGTGVKHLRVGDVENLMIPIPPHKEQQEIVTRVESLFAKADTIEKQYESLKAKIDNLPQALLHKAFKGELTEQLDCDGDARELLKEIEMLRKVQHDKSTKTKKGGKVVKGYEVKDEVLGMVAEPKEELQPKVVKLKPTNTEIYKRTLLAAEIVYQLKDTNTFGHLKLQKMLYLCQEIGSMNLPMNFLKQAMGPYDNQLARSLDKQFIIKKWFEYQNGALLKYKPLENCGKHKDDFLKFFENEIEQINYLINKFTKFTSNQIEAVATLYACWKEAIEQKELITDKLIITKFYQWSREKEKFREENLIKALDWMRRNGVEPK